MNKKPKHIFGNPLIYLAIGTIVGSYAYIAMNTYFLLGAVLAALFFSILFMTCNMRFAFIVSLISIASYGNTAFYYDYNLPRSHVEEIHIISVSDKFILGQCRGKLINVYSNYNIEEGSYLTARINFYHNKNLSRGIVGNVKIIRIEEKKKSIGTYSRRMKEEYFEKLSYKIGKSNSEFVMATALGESNKLEEELKDQMKTLGIIHVTAISGFHIGIIYGGLSAIFGNFIGVLGITTYIMLVGVKASVFRAYLMIMVSIIGKKLYRNDNGIATICLSAIIIIFLRPYYIVDVGFALSFLAILGIIMFSKKLMRMMYMLPKYLNKSISIALAAQIFTAPYMIIVFGEINISFLIGNIFLIPLISIIIVLGNVGLMVFKIELIFNFITLTLNYILNIFNVAREGLFMVSIKSFNIGIGGCAFYMLGLIVIFYNSYRRDEIYDRFDAVR